MNKELELFKLIKEMGGKVIRFQVEARNVDHAVTQLLNYIIDKGEVVDEEILVLGSERRPHLSVGMENIYKSIAEVFNIPKPSDPCPIVFADFISQLNLNLDGHPNSKMDLMKLKATIQAGQFEDVISKFSKKSGHGDLTKYEKAYITHPRIQQLLIKQCDKFLDRLKKEGS